MYARRREYLPLSRPEFVADMLADGTRMLAFSAQYRRASTRSLRLWICPRRSLLVCYRATLSVL